MAGDRCLQLNDVRPLLRLSRAIYTAKDPAARKRELLDGLCRLLDAEAAISVVTHVERGSANQTTLSIVGAGEEAGVSTNGELLEAQIAATALPAAPRGAPSNGSNHSTDAFPWRPLRRRYRRRGTTFIRDCLWCEVAGTERRVIACLYLRRSRQHTRRFSARDHALVYLLHSEMSWIYRPDLLLASPGALQLTPRERQTLQHLLAGEREREIAAHMRLSHNTVHHYVKALHRHFGVSSRSELLARWVS